MKKFTEKQKKFVKKAAIIGSGILAAYLAYKAGRKDGFEDGCFYAADCFTNELMSGDHYKMQALSEDDSGWFNVNVVSCDTINGRIKFVGQRYEPVEK